MAIDRVNAVLIGRVKDAEGFPCDLLEDPDTGAQSLAYEPETWWQKGELAKLRAAKTRSVPTGTPRRAWPGRPGKGVR